VIGDHRRREESRQLDPAVTIRCAHHGNLDAHVPQSSDAICPVSFDWGAPLEVEAKLGEELNGGIDVFYHYADVVHTLDGHDFSLALITCQWYSARTVLERQKKYIRIQYRRRKPYRLPNSCRGNSLSPTSSLGKHRERRRAAV